MITRNVELFEEVFDLYEYHGLPDDIIQPCVEDMMMMTGDVEFFKEVFDFYGLNKRRIKKALRISNDEELVDFCADLGWSFFRSKHIRHEYVCKLALIFSNILGQRLPDHIHARMVLDTSNKSCKEYVDYVQGLKPTTMLGFKNPNPNHFRMHTLSVNGTLSKLAWK
jgi:hypothetical protein